MIDTKPNVASLADPNNKSGSDLGGGGGGGVDKAGVVASHPRANGVVDAPASELKISLLPSVFEVVKTMEDKEAGKASASDVTNKLNQFHSKLKKARESVEKQMPAATIGNMTLDDQGEQLRILRDQLKMNSNLMSSYARVMSMAFVPPTPPPSTSATATTTTPNSSLMY